MTENGIQTGSGPSGPTPPAPGRAVLGKIALAVSLVPWAMIVALVLLRPG